MLFAYPNPSETTDSKGLQYSSNTVKLATGHEALEMFDTGIHFFRGSEWSLNGYAISHFLRALLQVSLNQYCSTNSLLRECSGLQVIAEANVCQQGSHTEGGREESFSNWGWSGPPPPLQANIS